MMGGLCTHTHIIIQDTKQSVDRDIRIQINIIGYTRKEHKVNEIIMFIHCFCIVICTITQLMHTNISIIKVFSLCTCI